MVFLKVIPTSLLFIHGSAGHCNLETGMCVCVCECVYDGFYKREKGGGSHRREKWREREKEEVGRREGWRGDVVWNMGLDFRP